MQSVEMEGKRGWLAAYAWWVAFCTLILICIGGLVTSKGVGMAVPDWPTTYGYNMFFFPLDQWTGGIFHEHLHRLVASVVGMLTLILAIWVQWTEPRSWVRRLAWAAFILVLVQGLLGGLRVRLNDQWVFTTTLGTLFGLTHATLAQLFFTTVSFLALVLSPVWDRAIRWQPSLPSGFLRGTTVVLLALIVQLLVAATMRHQHAGLAVPDFPLAYGQLYPSTNPEFLAQVQAQRMDYLHDAQITAFQIHLHMAHRFLAVLLLVGVTWLSIYLLRSRTVAGWCLGGLWLLLIWSQVGLGIATVLTNKAADFATGHVAVGALCLVTGLAVRVLMHRTRFYLKQNAMKDWKKISTFAAGPVTSGSMGH